MKSTNHNHIENEKQATVYYDIHCALCNGFVKTLQKRDRKKLFSFKPIQLSPYNNINSVVFVKNGIIYTKTEAVEKILTLLRTSPFIRLLLKLAPRKLSNKFYDIIAKYRHKLFATN